MNVENLGILLVPARPWLLKMRCSHSEATDKLWLFERQNSGSVVKFLRGKKMTTVQGLYDEFAAALQFPYYFGYNGGAFDECLTDLSWLPATTYVLTIFDSGALLVNEPAQRALFIAAFERACIQWSTRISLGEPWDRPAVPFHVIFHHVADDARQLPPEILGIPDVI